MATSRNDKNNNFSINGHMGGRDGVRPSAAAYLETVQNLLTKGMLREAYDVMQPAIMEYGDDPVLLSYFGWLTVAVVGRYREGLEACERAIHLFDRIWARHSDRIDERFKAVLYLNLGRAYLSSERRREAFESLHKGLRFDPQSRALRAELESMGVRKRVPVPFLSRSNPINNLVGRLLRKTRH